MVQKQSNMKSIYTFLKKQDEEGVIFDAQYNRKIDEISGKYALTILIADSSFDCLVSSNNNNEYLCEQLKAAFLKEPDYAILHKGDGYHIFLQDDPQTDVNYLILIGTLTEGKHVMIRCCYDGIKEASKAANLFLIYISLTAVLITALISYFLVGIFTRPLFKMIDITKRISNFDFSAKYYPQRIYNELDDLGEHVNEMSTTLERSISQLKNANDKLLKDLELKEETENMRKEFISNVSHELKTPIALIQGYAEGLQEGIMDDENSRQIYLDVILDEANKMNRLVKEMLVLNQLEAGQMSAELTDFDVTEMLNEIVENNQIYFEGQDINFSFVNKESCIVHSDEVLIEQVFSNFMSNAIHYVMNENVVTIRYEFSKKGKVRIYVFNSGNNISKKDIKHIWEKFYKADKARSREYGGSGIGLSVVKAIMDLLKEKFGVDNTPNGVEFWIELPLSKNKQIKQNS